MKFEIQDNAYLSEHFTLAESVHSDKATQLGIQNIPDFRTLSVMYMTALQMEKIRTLVGKPITVNSWFRNPQVNQAVGSKDTSQHLKGEAVDWVSPEAGTPLELAKLIIKNKELIKFDQLILEHTWLHISFAILSGSPKGQVLSLLSTGGYSTGLTDKNGNPY